MKILSIVGAALFRRVGRWPQTRRVALSKCVAWLVRPFVQKRRNVARVNLKKCFPTWSDAQIEQTIDLHLTYFSQSFFDRALFWFGSKTAIAQQVRLIDEGFWHAAVATGRPIIILAPHFVGLDVGGSRLNLLTDLSSIYQRQSNAVFDALFREGRAGMGKTYLFSRQEGVRGLVKLMKNKVPMYCLPDMDFGLNGAIFAPFFGVSAATLTVLPKLSKLTNAIILPCVTRLDSVALARGETLYNAQFYAPWENYPCDDEALCVQLMNEFIQARILEEPAQYLWLHKRFKTRPQGEASFY